MTKAQISKEEEQNIWKSIKEKKSDLSLEYCSVKIGINMSGDVEQKEFVAPLSNY